MLILLVSRTGTPQAASSEVTTFETVFRLAIRLAGRRAAAFFPTPPRSFQELQPRLDEIFERLKERARLRIKIYLHRRLRAELRSCLRDFNRIRAIAPADRQNIKHAATRQLTFYSLGSVLNRRARTVTRFVSLTSFMVWIFLGPFIVQAIVGELHPELFLSLLAVFLLAFWIALYQKLFPRFNIDRGLTASILVVAAIGMLVGAAHWPCAQTSAQCFSNLLAGVAVAGGPLLLILLATLMTWTEALYELRVERQFPLAFLVHRLLRTIRLIEDAGPSWLLPEYRSEIMTDLDRAAALLQYQIFPKLRTDDRAVWSWRQDHARMVGNAIRSREIWLITPQAGTREALAKDLGAILVATLTGEWDRLPVLESRAVTWRERYSALVDFGRAVLTAILPILLFLAAQSSQIVVIESPIRDYITGALIVWAAISLLSTLDPTLKEKIATAKDVFSVLPGAKKKE